MAQAFYEVVSPSQGDYFVVTNPTAGTGVATTTSIQAEDQTKPVLLIVNQGMPGDPSARSIYLDDIHLQCAAVPTSSTNWACSLILDNTSSKYTSGGSSLSPKCINGNFSAASVAAVYFGAVVAVTGNLSGPYTRRAHNSILRTVIPVVGDQYVFTTTGPDAANTISGTNAIQLVSGIGPIVIGPGQSLSLCMWGASNAAASQWEVTAGWREY